MNKMCNGFFLTWNIFILKCRVTFTMPSWRYLYNIIWLWLRQNLTFCCAMFHECKRTGVIIELKSIFTAHITLVFNVLVSLPFLWQKLHNYRLVKIKTSTFLKNKICFSWLNLYSCIFKKWKLKKKPRKHLPTKTWILSC